MTQEAAAHALLVAEAAGAGDACDGPRPFLQRPARRLEAEPFHGLGWRRADALRVDPGEIAWAHAGAFGERLDSQIRGEVPCHPFMERKKAAIVLRLRFQHGRELRLSAGPFQE